MLFISNGAQLLEKKIETARRRMFLFSDDVEPPTNKSSYPEMIDTINKSRSFCALVNAQNEMQCVRGAGWKGNRLYYNYAPSIRKSGFSQNYGSPTVSAIDMFCRYYAIGKLDAGAGTAQEGRGSLLDSYGSINPIVPAYYDMVLPAFDGSTFTKSLYSVPTTSAGMTSSSGGTIYGGGGSGIGRWSRSETSYLQNIGITSLNIAADTATVTTNVMTLDPLYAGTPYDHQTFANTIFPRLFQPYASSTYGSYYFSGGGWSYTTSYSGAAIGSSAAQADAVYFGQGTHEDTPSYGIKWGAMPIAFARTAPVYVVVSKSGVDFDVASDIDPNEVPVASMNTYSPHVVERRFLM